MSYPANQSAAQLTDLAACSSVAASPAGNGTHASRVELDALNPVAPKINRQLLAAQNERLDAVTRRRVRMSANTIGTV